MSQGLHDEQGRLDAFYALLDLYTEHVQDRIEAVGSAPGTGTGQDLIERQAELDHWYAQASAARAAEQRLCFGRLDFAAEAGGHTHYIGRMGLRDDNGNPVLLDWRAPGASSFYQGTFADPQGIERRRRIITKGRTVTHVDDEDLSDPVHTTTGAAAASVDAPRSGRMSDIVATIAADQDAIVRAPLGQVTIVEGGPGTGKTVVALHRAAWLLYTYRDKLARDGVLVVGPSKAFLTYIDQVLPSLGETDVVLLTPGQLYPDVSATRYDTSTVSAIKGDLRMTKVIAAALRHLQRIPDHDVTIVLEDNTEAKVTARQLAEAKRAVPRSASYHGGREPFLERVLTHMVRARAQARGWDDSDPDLRADALADLTGDRHVRRVLNLMWMPTHPITVLTRLWSEPAFLASAAHGLLTAQEQVALLNAWDGQGQWSVDDAVLLDELAEQLGPWDPNAKRVRVAQERERAANLAHAAASLGATGTEGWLTADALAERHAPVHQRLSVAERALADRSWTYGHVIVDEAQELSPMAWHCLARRTNRVSMTVVGDLQQTTHAAGVRSWDQLFTWAAGKTDLHTLTITYRITRQTAQCAAELLVRFGGHPPALTAIRDGIEPITHSCLPEELAAWIMGAVDGSQGRFAVIVPDEQYRAWQELLPSPDFATGDQALESTVAVLTARETKGLEFDLAFVVNPDLIGRQTERGADLYVAATRATQVLYLVEAWLSR